MNAPTEVLDDPVEATLPPAERRWLRWLRRAGWALAGLYFLVAVGMLALRYLVLPHIPDYKAEIAAAVSRALGERVEIAGIKAEWFGLHARLELDGVRVIDRRGAAALSLSHVGAAISWRSLAVGELRFKSLVIDRPELLIRRDAHGRLFVAGLEVQAADRPESGGADWVLRQGEILIRDAVVEWDDEARRAVPLRLERVEFVLQNDGRHHRFAVRAEPPAAYASSIDIRGELTGRTLEQVQDWNGRIYAHFDYIDLAAWQPWIDYPFEVRDGRGALRLWLGFGDGALTELAAEVALAHVAARFGDDLPLLEMRTLTGQFGVKKNIARALLDLDGVRDLTYEAYARQLALVAKDGTALAPADFTANWAPAEGRTPQRGHVVAQSMELAPLAHFVEFLPIPEAYRSAVARMAPEGKITDLRFRWTGELDAPQTYAARGEFAHFGVSPYGSLPGVARLRGSFDVSERGGKIAAAGDKVTVASALFVEPTLGLDTLNARFEWGLARGELEVRLENIAFANPELAGTVSGVYRVGAAGERGLDVSGRLSRVEGKHAYKYIPKLGPKMTLWVQQGILSGTAHDVRVRLRGDPAHFPFDDSQLGEFTVTGRVADGTLHYADNWPPVTQITADVTLTGRKMQIATPRALALGAQLTNVVVTIPDIFHRDTPILIDGEASGPFAEFLGFVAGSPVRQMLGGLTDRWAGDGRSKLALHLELPLANMPGTKVAGSFQFIDNGLDLGPGEPTLAQVNGRVDFTEASVSARNLVAQTLGGAVSVQLGTRRGEGGTRANAVIVSTVQGTVDSVQLAKMLDLPLAERVRGPMQFRYRTVRRSGGVVRSVFESSLANVAVDLPAPFGKPAGETWPLRIERSPLAAEGEGASVPRAAITASLGTVLNVQAQVRNDGTGAAVERATIAIGDTPTRRPDGPGVYISAKLAALDLDHLLPVLNQTAKKGAPAFAVSGVDLRTDKLTVGGRIIHDVALAARFNELHLWNATITARELAGDVSWEPEGKGAIAARLKYLVHPARAPETAPEDDLTRDLPALAIVADSYRFEGRELGRLEVQAVNSRGSWRLDRMELAAPEGTLVASGQWQRQGTDERTDLDIKVEVRDIGRYLARFGFEDTITRGTASLNGKLFWYGPVYRIDHPSLTGELNVRAEKGQFVKVNPGVGKLLGVLSLQSLPRRLTLDFHDVFSEGFAFDSIAGTAKIVRGTATADDLTMIGPAASVAITGKVDFVNETQDLTVRVVPIVGDSIAVAAGIALLNPLIGAGAFLAQRLLRDPLGQILAYEYQISGKWEDPKVRKVRAPPSSFESDDSRPEGVPR